MFTKRYTRIRHMKIMQFNQIYFSVKVNIKNKTTVWISFHDYLLKTSLLRINYNFSIGFYKACKFSIS